MTTTGVGLIGCGNISAAYLRLAPLFKGLEIRAVADINPDMARARAKEFGVEARSVDDILASDDISVIVNLTIPAAHYEVSTRVLEAGKHVYSEKPLVLTLDEAKALADLARSKNLRVGSAPDTFLGGAHQQVRALIDDGAIGKVVGGTAHVMSRGMEHWHPNPDFFFLPGAGPVLDIGPYYITNLIQLLGPIARVGALTSAATDTRTILSEPRKGETIPVKTPTNIHALLEFKSGATVTLGASWDVKAHRHAPMELYGTEGTLFVPDPNFFGGLVEQADEQGTISPVTAWDHPFGRPNEGDDGNGKRANYRMAGLADMIAGLQASRPHRCSLELAVHAVDAMTSILVSGEKGEFITLSTTCERPAPLGPDEAAALLA
ncbi:Gfo/Idh/MocA family oxidoreductase [Alphaproteobacteria bacterium GH1-50]|uniref:Gfo/Idh/MocA family oxidoreductase n=1 Tax=Kangsaoukella pontilimi TaxID=2691042 RepID=A0A7C9MZD4_9RHOB|nr:Gfo/Idh/MocA family oxidoreductase [Kangsaoukella pontilimi]MXQ09834.1 Gfo/Idh/MocA family oxidoreductase [Kangsaoukella pontilimi]